MVKIQAARVDWVAPGSAHMGILFNLRHFASRRHGVIGKLQGNLFESPEEGNTLPSATPIVAGSRLTMRCRERDGT